MILKEVLEKSVSFLKTKNIESFKLDSELLISDSLNLKRLDLYLQYERPLSEVEMQLCRERIMRRAKGEPVSLIVGHRDFCGQRYIVNQDVLTPRFETEELVEKAVQLFIEKKLFSTPTVVLDLGAGSGCVGISFLLMFKKSMEQQKSRNTDFVFEWPQIIAVEKSEKAMLVLKQNETKLLPPELQKFYHAVLADCTQPEHIFQTEEQKSKTHLILGNPPYIANNSSDVAADVLKYEPKQALFGGPVGTEAPAAWAAALCPFLQANGLILFEIGFDQGQAMTRIFQSLGLQDVQIFKDMSGHDRMISGRK